MRIESIEQTRSPSGKLRLRLDNGKSLLLLPTVIAQYGLYPGLELPFMGKVNTRNQPVTPLTELQTLAFAIQDLALYLDTHREDREAFELYQAYQEMYHKCMMEFQKNRSPVNHRTPAGGDCYRWLDDPWPWEYCHNKEG